MNKQKVLALLLVLPLFLIGCTNNNSSNYSGYDYSEEPLENYSDSYEDNSLFDESTADDYDAGYQWAEDEDISDFDDCQDQFGTGDAEDGCNDYVKENYSGRQEFMGYECTEDCSGHEAGYEWASDNDIDDEYDCDGNSDSFNEGCQAYVEENY